MLRIIDDLPAGTTVEIAGELTGFSGFIECPGGTLCGAVHSFTAQLKMPLAGTGSLAGYTRSITMATVPCQTMSAPRTPGATPQSFDTDFAQRQGQLPPGDPDFDLLRITAGTSFGLPSPGHTTLLEAGAGTWNVDSFFDLTYRIDFVGAPGSTTGTICRQLGSTAVFDHLDCFTAKDTLKLKGVVTLPALADGLYDAAGRKLGKAKKYCTPVARIVTTANIPVTPLPGPSLGSDYVCYPMTCPKVTLTQGIVDRFRPRVLSTLKQKELCVPAQKAP